MFKKLLASVGIGSAKVDTQLENDYLVPGEEVRGKVIIQGGGTEQHIDRINLFVMTEAVRESNDRKVYEKVKLGSFSIGDSFTIREGEVKEFDFQFVLPIHTPPSLGRTKVWVQTGLDVPSAIDPTDKDFIKVSPHPYMDTILEALTKGLGFQLRKVEMEYSRRYNYIQEFEFYPGNMFRRDLDELEAMFFMYDDRVDVLLQIDRRAKGLGGLFAEALDMDENFVKVSFSRQDIDRGTQHIAEEIRNIIESYS
ncbi:sporulation protein [Ornithinibacillus scapharcae]|uniref:sporulation protein n=1 Tax=Ornithinibacillus scapharcae TaxID=1147159 RepID=UPI000225BABB|nr:sporulation protein [Ornithinibacillus scapharcae]